ncbi:hypothetical protein PYCCODRAFT_629190 [Trametes coccinea BRFM310]|uniref:Uncharacterized protein n=1 Tax=Trametes coccinea (strain BRFM310) TaxID=1353009 RepID=A0A1Y2J2G1_TRAC3|nr:hypothetical protein PYCCODRAFT_629190 [Trametes coccinea BRFM310]
MARHPQPYECIGGSVLCSMQGCKRVLPQHPAIGTALRQQDAALSRWRPIPVTPSTYQTARHTRARARHDARRPPSQAYCAAGHASVSKQDPHKPEEPYRMVPLTGCFA